MKNHIQIKSLIVGAVLGVVALISIGATTDGRPRPTWEHKIVVHKSGTPLQDGLERPLDEAGKEGWEPVSLGMNGTQPFVLMKRLKLFP